MIHFFLCNAKHENPILVCGNNLAGRQAKFTCDLALRYSSYTGNHSSKEEKKTINETNKYRLKELAHD
jgi:hypothetical protein